MTQTTTKSDVVIQILTTNIDRNPRQPRQWFNTEELDNLADSIRQHGIIQPLVVAPSGKPDIYTLIAGERRLIAARRAELETVPAIVREVTDEIDFLVLALIENVDREEMTIVEAGDGYLALRKEKGWSNAEIAKKVGKNDVYVGNCIFAASLPQKTRDLINKGQLFVSNQFISRMHEVAEINPKACDELAQQIADSKPGLKVAIKTASTVLNQLSALKEEKPTSRKKKKNIFDAASKIVD